MGCSPGSKFTCILSLGPASPRPRVLFPSGPWSSLAVALVFAMPRCSPETTRVAACLHKQVSCEMSDSRARAAV